MINMRRIVNDVKQAAHRNVNHTPAWSLIAEADSDKLAELFVQNHVVDVKSAMDVARAYVADRKDF